MGKGSKRRPGSNYEANFEKIFGDKKAVTSAKRYGGRQREQKSGIHIVEDIEPFKSPVTGEIISSRSQLRQHHREHGTTDSRDYSASYYEKAQRRRELEAQGKRASDRKNRIEILREILN
jgi:hypothetical protein